jgi:hypothetical protein
MKLPPCSSLTRGPETALSDTWVAWRGVSPNQTSHSFRFRFNCLRVIPQSGSLPSQNAGQEIGLNPYTIGDAMFDALIIFGYDEEGSLRYAARARNGFTPAIRQSLLEKFRNLETEKRPFTNLPEKHGGRWGCMCRSLHLMEFSHPHALLSASHRAGDPNKETRQAGLYVALNRSLASSRWSRRRGRHRTHRR